MKKILVADPEKNTTYTLQRLLEAEQFNVFAVATLQEANAILNEETFDLVVINPDMPGKEEFDPVEWLQNFSKGTKIIVLAGESDSTVRPGNIIGAFPHPVNFFTLVNVIKTHLSEKGFSGILNDISLEDYIQIFCINRAMRAILVTRKGERGIILIHDGQVVYAVQGSLQGEEAFCRILSWKTGTFKEIKVKKFPKANIAKDYRFLLLEAANRRARQEEGPAEPDSSDSGERAPEQCEEQILMPGSGAEPDQVAVSVAETASGKAGQVSDREATLAKKVAEKKKGGRGRLKRGLALMALVPVLLLVFGKAFIWSESTPPQAAATANAETQPQKVENAPAVQPRKAESAPAGQLPKAAVAASADQPASSSLQQGVQGSDGAVTDIIEQPPSEIVKREDDAVLPEEVILRLHGSNTIGAQLAPALVTHYLTDLLGAESVKKVPGEKENEVLLKARFADHVEVVEIHAHGSTTGFEDMATGKCDIAMASRKIKDDEREQLKMFGDMTAITNEHVIALDGIAVIVNRANGLELLSMEQIAGIFSGAVSDWRQLGGTGGVVRVYARDDNSGTYDTFKSIVLTKNAELKANAKRFESNPELSAEVAGDSAGIGFTSLANVNSAKAVAVADEGAAPILPSFFTVATEDYPIARRLYLYTAANSTNGAVGKFVEYVQSFRGQEVVKEVGLVDMNIKSFNTEHVRADQLVNPEQLKEYMSVAGEAKRLSVNFRFKAGETALDNRAMRDLDRMVDYLKSAYDKQVVLAGFADNAGEYAYNYRLARERAQVVAEQLRLRGISIKRVVSGGEELPVATNLSEVGREKNRRVEVWLQ